MPRFIGAFIFVIGATLIFLSLRGPGDSGSSRRSEEPPQVLHPSIPSPAAQPTIISLPIASEASTALRSAEATAEDDLSTIELILTEYGRHHLGNPVGENVEITAALLGKNSRRVAYLDDHGPYLDNAARLIDRWGTPYFFHQLSAKQTEIRSAGPDRSFHTADDLVR
ncbi:MAG TPA: hypothetical protein VM511_06075 [Luteolibacter sp.]|nr:hypothetical protein [Luteolibacter sp.]